MTEPTTSPAPLPKHILIPVDYGELSSRALEVGLELAGAFGARVDILYVWSAPYAQSAVSGVEMQGEGHNLFDLVREQSGKAMEEFLAPYETKTTGLDVNWFVESGMPQADVVDHAEKKGCDLIVMGSHGRKALSRWLLGSVAEYVVRHAPCPVMIIPGSR
jgi:universal stress protein A